MRLSADHISVVRGGRTIVDDITVSVSSGDFVVCAGANGAGKTVLLHVLAGLIEPSTGTVSSAPKSANRPAIVFQEPDSQILGRTVEGDIRIGLADHHDSKRLKWLLDFAGLADRRDELCHRLSGGEKRRLTVASAFAMQPELLFLDEPFTYLDAAGVCDVLRQILAIHRAGCGILLVTHDLEKVAAHANRLLLLRNGRLAYDGPPSGGRELLAACGLRQPPGSIVDWSWID